MDKVDRIMSDPKQLLILKAELDRKLVVEEHRQPHQIQFLPDLLSIISALSYKRVQVKVEPKIH